MKQKQSAGCNLRDNVQSSKTKGKLIKSLLPLNLSFLSQLIFWTSLNTCMSERNKKSTAISCKNKCTENFVTCIFSRLISMKEIIMF